MSDKKRSCDGLPEDIFDTPICPPRPKPNFNLRDDLDFWLRATRRRGPKVLAVNVKRPSAATETEKPAE